MVMINEVMSRVFSTGFHLRMPDGRIHDMESAGTTFLGMVEKTTKVKETVPALRVQMKNKKKSRPLTEVIRKAVGENKLRPTSLIGPRATGIGLPMALPTAKMVESYPLPQTYPIATEPLLRNRLEENKNWYLNDKGKPKGGR